MSSPCMDHIYKNSNNLKKKTKKHEVLASEFLTTTFLPSSGLERTGASCKGKGEHNCTLKTSSEAGLYIIY